MSGIVLSIGTTHPWNVAGIGRDLIVGCSFGARVFTAVAAVTAQDRRGVVGLDVVDADVFEAELSVLPWEAAGAVRVGALPTASSLRAVADALRAHPG
ncbi:MAG: bifunctional hydroxymethylpyrimidine kinase/phosphomethylpyrimidine kinase, partial [Candidatus Baltobacteraceae bacterium]